MSVRLPFTVTHNFNSVVCCLVLGRENRLLEIQAVGPRGDGNGPLGLFAGVCERLEFLNDLLRSDIPLEMLATCRRSPGLFGAIIDPAITEMENLRAAVSPPGGADVA